MYGKAVRDNTESTIGNYDQYYILTASTETYCRDHVFYRRIFGIRVKNTLKSFIFWEILCLQRH